MRLCLALCLSAVLLISPAAAADPLKLKKDDRIVFIGNTLAERMLYTGNLETEIYRRHPQLDLVIRNADLATASDRQRCDIGVRDGRVVALAESLGPAKREVDAAGALVRV